MKPIQLTDSNFEETISSGITLVDFWAEWCMPCKMQGPIVASIAEKIGDKASICKLDVEANGATPAKFQITGIPTIIVFKDGEIVQKFVGLQNEHVLLQTIEQNL